MICQQIPKANFRILGRLYNAVLLSDRVKAHGKRSANRIHLFYRDVKIIGDLLVCNVRIFDQVLPNFQIQIRV